MSLPYFPLFVTDYDADTAHLSLLEDGIYMRLLRLCWRSPWCRVPDDETWIFRAIRARTPEEQHATRAVLTEFFSVKAGKVFNRRLFFEWEKAQESYARRASAGSRGGLAKARKQKERGPSNAKAMLPYPEPELNTKEGAQKSAAMPRPETIKLAMKMGRDG